MPQKIDPDATPGVKLLRLFRKLLLDGRRHYQQDLAEELQCSAQTVIRMTGEIESVIGMVLQSGLDRRRRWYRYVPNGRGSLGLNFEELRFLDICRELASDMLPRPVLARVDDTIRRLALYMADPAYVPSTDRRFAFYAKGRIDYTPHAGHIEKLVEASRRQRICLVRYRATGKEAPREHRFIPVRLAAMNNALYALGAQVNKNFMDVERPCNLAVHRIHDVIVTDKHLRFNLADDGMATFGLPWHEPRSFHIRFSPQVAEYVRERTWAESQHMRDTADGGLVLVITTRSEPELCAWVRSFGDAAKILRESGEDSCTAPTATKEQP